MMRSLFSGVSGLKTHQTKMDVIGNNISNVNTVAFKSSSTTFQDLMYQTTSRATEANENKGGKNAKQIGLGVTNGATKISITSAGAAQSTGDALDIRLTDTKTTNFFVVSNGTENLFTRAGSFYIDGNGNLAMTTTGYYVMGWQVDDEGIVQRDTVSPLRVMRAENQTSAPEATTNVRFSGVVDKYDTNVTSSSGYYRSVTYYDDTGYSYTAKFSIKKDTNVDGKYTIELVNILDSQGEDVLKAYTDQAGNTLSSVFGNDTTAQATYGLNSGFTYTIGNDGKGELFYTTGGVKYQAKEMLTETVNGQNVAVGYVFKADGQTDIEMRFTDVFATDATIAGIAENVQYPEFSVENGVATTKFDVASADAFTISYTYPTVNYDLVFDTATGLMQTANGSAAKTLTLEASRLGPAMKDITIDVSTLLNYDNGGTSTVTVQTGALDGTTGKGKKLGNMTGLSVGEDGKIYGSYSNGNTVCLGQIAVAQFANASGLEEVGDNCYKTTLNSGTFDGIGLEISADGSSMATGQLEMSNVDLSSEFTEMITTQRGFQANSRIITVSDTLLEELINLKR